MTAVYCFLHAEEYSEIAGLISKPDTILIPLECRDWNRDLSPWPAPKVFSKGEDFSGGAEQFFQELVSEIIPGEEEKRKIHPDKRILAGYSLAGLFAVYAAAKTNLFEGIASVSGSLWFDGFLDYFKEHTLDSSVKKVYFSVGEKEKKAGNPRMKRVEDCTRQAFEIVKQQGVETVFDLNPGGHFANVPERIAKALLWLI